MSTIADVTKLMAGLTAEQLAELIKSAEDKKTALLEADRLKEAKKSLIKAIDEAKTIDALTTALIEALKSIAPAKIGSRKGKTVTTVPTAPTGGVAKLIGDLTKAGESPEIIAGEVAKVYPDSKTANNVNYVKQYIQKYGFVAPAPAPATK